MKIDLCWIMYPPEETKLWYKYIEIHLISLNTFVCYRKFQFPIKLTNDSHSLNQFKFNFEMKRIPASKMNESTRSLKLICNNNFDTEVEQCPKIIIEWKCFKWLSVCCDHWSSLNINSTDIHYWSEMFSQNSKVLLFKCWMIIYRWIKAVYNFASTGLIWQKKNLNQRNRVVISK